MPSSSASTAKAVELPPYPKRPTDCKANVESTLQKPFPVVTSAPPVVEEYEEQDIERLSIASTLAVVNDRPKPRKLKNLFKVLLEVLLTDPLKTFMWIIILTCVLSMVILFELMSIHTQNMCNKAPELVHYFHILPGALFMSLVGVFFALLFTGAGYDGKRVEHTARRHFQKRSRYTLVLVMVVLLQAVIGSSGLMYLTKVFVVNCEKKIPSLPPASWIIGSNPMDNHGMSFG